MTKAVHFVAAALATVLICSAAGAQMRGGGSPTRISSVRMAPAARAVPTFSRGIRPMRPIQLSSSGRVPSSFTPNAYATSYGSTIGVPGLGFDYPHLAAIGGGLRNGRFSNSGRGGRGNRAVIVPIFAGGFPYYYYDFSDPYDDSFYDDTYGYDQPQPQQQPQQQAQQQPQVIVVQQPVPMAQPVDEPGTYAAPSAAPPVPAPVRDVGEFVLVRRDGRILFASAYSVTGMQLTYVTLEGIRRTIPLADLDANATQQMNEARGTTVQIHN